MKFNKEDIIYHPESNTIGRIRDIIVDIDMDPYGGSYIIDWIREPNDLPLGSHLSTYQPIRMFDEGGFIKSKSLQVLYGVGAKKL